MDEARDRLDCEICIVGGGPAGLSCAIHLTNLINNHNQSIEDGKIQADAIDIEDKIILVEKGASFGSHGFSGAVIQPIFLDKILSNFEEKKKSFLDPVTDEQMYFFTKKGKIPIPFHLPGMSNKGNYIISLSKLTKWMSEEAESLGISLLPEFAAVQVLTENDAVVGIRTGDKEYNTAGKPELLGTDIYSKALVIAEGPRGTISKQVIRQFDLQRNCNVDAYEYGVKEIYQLPETRLEEGTVIHTVGWPLDQKTSGGTFIYQMRDNVLCIGLVVYLKNADPLLDAHRSLQQFKQHPFIQNLIRGAKQLAYGGKVLPSGGYYSIPQTYMNGALLVGDSAQLVNPLTFKGIHAAVQSGMLAAETLFEGMKKQDYSESMLKSYHERLMQTDVVKTLKRNRNFTTAISKGFPFPAVFDLGIQMVTGGASMFSHKHAQNDRDYTKPIKEYYKKDLAWVTAIRSDDSKKIVDKLTDVYLTGSTHDEAQPSHLIIHHPEVCVERCAPAYQAPCSHFCPASVYEIQKRTNAATGKEESFLQVNFSNCIHCKTCDIKCPFDNIEWTPPQGGEGPKYTLT